jgi:ribosome-binding factor A
MADSQRIKKINELIKRELGAIILKQVDYPKDLLLTLSKVECSSGLRDAKIWVSVMPEKKAIWILSLLERNIYHIQKTLDKRLKMRPIPKIRFLKQEKIENTEKVDEILEKIKKDNLSQ